MVQIVHKAQHLLKHIAEEIRYNRLGILQTVKSSLDDLYGIVSSALNWKDPVDTKADLPLVGNTLNDARVVQDGPALYVCIDTVGGVDAQWRKIADYDWGSIFDGTVNDGDLVKRDGILLTKASAEDVMNMVLDEGVSNGDLVKYNSATHKFEKVTGIPEMFIVAKHALATFTNNAGVQEKGATLNAWTFNWTFNRNTDNPTSQTISPDFGAQAVANRSLVVSGAGITATKTYTMNVIGDDTNPTALSTVIYFRSKRYFGVSSSIYSTGDEIMTNISPQNNEFVTSRVTSKTFDASIGGGNNYLYIAYPAVLGMPTSTKIGGLAYTDYTATTVSLTNAQGHTENYIILRTNNPTSSSSITWEIF